MQSSWQQSPRRICSRLGWAYFTLMVVSQGLALAASVAVSLLWTGSEQIGGWLVWIVSYVPLYGVAAPLFALMIRRWFAPVAPPTGDLKMSPGLFVRLFVVLMGGTYVLNYVSLGLNYLISGQLVNTLDTVTQAAGYWPSVIVGCIIAPIGEELLFRKALYRAGASLGEKGYALLGGLVFALFHGNLSQLLYAFLAGVVLCWLYLRTGRLGWCILMHMAINTMGIAVGPLATSSNGAALALSLAVVVLMAGALVLLARVRRWLRFASGAGLSARQVLAAAFSAPGMLAYAAVCLALVAYASLMPLL